MKKRKAIRYIIYVVAVLLLYVGSLYFDHRWYVDLMGVVIVALIVYLHGWRHAFFGEKDSE